MELEGKVILDLGMQQGTSQAGNNWKKHEFVLETFGQYPKKVKFDIFGENRCNNIILEIGNSYVLTVEANSREFNGRWYTDITCLAARPYTGQGVAPGGYPQPGYPQQPAYQQPAAQPFGGSAFPPAPTPGNAPQPFDGGDATDDLPF